MYKFYNAEGVNKSCKKSYLYNAEPISFIFRSIMKIKDSKYSLHLFYFSNSGQGKQRNQHTESVKLAVTLMADSLIINRIKFLLVSSNKFELSK